VVCLFAVYPSGASSALRLDESKIRVSLEETQTRVSLEVESGEAHSFNARLTVALLDPRDKVRAESESDVQVRRGQNSFSVPIKLPYAQLLEAERKQFPWYRLRYRVAPEANASAAAVEGVVSLSEVTPDLFELRVVSSSKARAGSELRARVRTVNPVTGRAVKGVAVSGELKFDGDEAPAFVKASALTGGDGLATLDFRVPRGVDDDGELKITARRGAFADTAESSVSVEQKPRIILTTDKMLYQPGQTLHARALVFDPSDRAIAGEEVTLKLDDPEGSTVFSSDVKTSRYGIATADWPIPDSTKLGWYTLSIEMEDSRYDVDYGTTRGVRISRYDLPNFTVSTKPDRPYYLAGQNAEIEVRGDYLFGQPVKRAHVRVVRQTERRWDYEQQKYVTEEQDPIEGELDEQGRFSARIDLSKEHAELADSSYRRFEDLAYAAYVTDATTNRTEQRRFYVRLTKGPIHLYVNEGRYRQTKGLPLAFYISASYADGSPAECEVSVIEVGRTTVTQPPGEPRHEVKEPDKTLLKVKTNRYGVAKVMGPLIKKDETRASIPLRFVARDGEGREGRHEEDFWLEHYYSREAPQLRIETDKTIYREGEPVNVEVTSDSERLSAVVDVTVEGRAVYSKPVRLTGGRASLVLPYSPEFRDAVIISATGTDFYGDADDEYFSSGARTVVFPRDRELKLDVRMSRAKYQPGDDAVAQFAVRTASGRGAEGALGVVVFDKAVEERARTDEEFSKAWGFGDSLYGFWYSTWDVAGFTQRDIEKLDPSRPVPDGLDEVAELLYNGDRYDDGGRNVFGGTRFLRSHAEAFQELVGARLASVRDALKRRYDASAEYPTDMDSLARILSAAGVDFNSLRDPWGRPFRAVFYAEGPHAVLEIMSDGMDKRAGTDDDFGAAGFTWPYFRKVAEAMNRAAAGYHARTGGYVRDLATLGEELRREGIDLGSLRDPWGQPYSFEFDVTDTHYRVRVHSSGPNKSFEPRGVEDSDDFTLWTTLIDYFAETRVAIDEALASSLRETGSFPETVDELRAALKRRGIDFDALRDGWGNKLYAAFPSVTRYADQLSVESRGVGVGAADTRRDVKPVTQVLRKVTLRSVGPDLKSGTPDDFTLGYYTSIATEQSGSDAKPRPVQPVTSFSGATGAINGTVIDPQGAAVPNAKVTAKHRLVELSFNATTNDEGAYILRNLPSGIYDVTCEASGFHVALIKDVQVQSSNLTKADFTLSVAGASETVEVRALNDSTLQTSSMSVSKVVERVAHARMPLSTPRLREFFPETLVWQPAVETDRDGHAEVRFKLADNITTWKMSVIASTEDGHVGTYEKEFISSQPFFIEHDPPRVLTEGDRVSLPVVLRNYLERAQGVDVEMKPEVWFALEGPSRRRADVPAGEAARPTFDFRAVSSIENGKQRVTAIGSDASDAVEKPVTVHPDGEEQAATDSAIFNDTGALSFEVPADVVRGSVRSELKIYPNLSAHLLEGVEAIMKRPYGCGEQTISSSYPSLLVLRYFEKDGELDEDNLPPLGARALRYAQQGYERLLRYRAPGGGFTYWGRGEPDLALTAYALRFLSDASRVIEVDEDVIKETRAWLVGRQREDGSWPAIRWWDKQEDPRQTAINTAFIARVLAATRQLEKPTAPAAQSQTAQSQTQTQTQPQSSPSQSQPRTSTTRAADAPKQSATTTPLERALRYLASRVSEIDEPYLIASYALASSDAGDDAAVALAAKRLVALAHEEGADTYWALETNTPFYGWGLAGRVETTALALKALNRYCGMRNADCELKKDESSAAVSPSSTNPKSAFRIPQLIERGLLFLLRSKDRYGVWYSTQATVNVHDALASLVTTSGGGATGGVAEIFVNGRRAGALDMPPATQLTGPILFDLSPFVSAGVNRVEVRRPSPAPLAQAQTVTTFYVPWTRQPTFTIDGTTSQGVETAKNGETWKNAQASAKSGDASSLRLSVSYDRPSAAINQEVTCSVEAERVGHKGYGMMLAEVGLPPGADVDRESLDQTMKESGWSINSYDVLPDRLVLYLWPASGGARFQFKFRPRYGLDALTAPSTLYDYYNPEAHAVVPPTRFVVR
jgi:hypothetical protein